MTGPPAHAAAHEARRRDRKFRGGAKRPTGGERDAVADRVYAKPRPSHRLELTGFVDTRALGPLCPGGKDVQIPRTRPPYPPEFRRQAVALIRSGTPLKQVAADLGVKAAAAFFARETDHR
jgi:hypothetical protein